MRRGGVAGAGPRAEMRRGGLAGAGPRRRCAVGAFAGAARYCEPRGISPEMPVLRAARDLVGDAPRGPRKKKLGRFFIFLAPDPTAARLASSGYGWTGRKFRPVRRCLVVPYF
ncbi:hypothetical protein VPH35_048689 [Triticum aestivum]